MSIERYSMPDNDAELSELLKEVAEDLTDEAYVEFSELIGDVHSFERTPFAVWLGLAHALADASGHRIVLQAANMECIPDQPGSYRVKSWRDVARIEPNLFVESD